MIYPAKPNRISEDSDLFKQIDTDPHWIAEKKVNGWRCIVEIEAPQSLTEGYAGHIHIKLYSRHGKEFEQPLEEIRRELQGFPSGIYDGELTGPRLKGQEEMLHLFDIVKLKDTWLTHLTLRHRKALLDESVPGAETIKVVHPYDVGKVNLFKMLKEEYKDTKPELRPVEGIVLKETTSEYVFSHFKPSSELINKRWLKVLI